MINLHSKKSNRFFLFLPFINELKVKKKDILSEVGFEPTPTFVDQNAHCYEVKSLSLESGALDRSAILTLLFINKTSMVFKLSYIKYQILQNKCWFT